MEKRIKKILLVDDDVNMNFYNDIIIKDLNICDEIIPFQNGREALDYLTTKIDGAYPNPEIIFLDINMPIMNGWEFLEAYKDLLDSQKAKIIVTMLTSSLNPDDKDKAKQYDIIKEFISKPLTQEAILEIVDKYLSL